MFTTLDELKNHFEPKGDWGKYSSVYGEILHKTSSLNRGIRDDLGLVDEFGGVRAISGSVLSGSEA